ncbi:MAG: MurT ligase domain-containing protein [Cyanobacteria bacterium]|nr:MurT ligase domain-containing protein [Cyanobacteriota bacterium]
MAARLSLAIALAKLAKATIKLLKQGAGSALPGRVALAIEPQALTLFADQLKPRDLSQKVQEQGLRAPLGFMRSLLAINENSRNAAIGSSVTNLSKLQSMVTGTNGKTTTSGILKEIYKAATNQDPISNDMGANLYYGIVAELINSSTLGGKLKSNHYVLEVDEAAFPEISKQLVPSSILVTNLFRDQLDRFGETDTTQKLIVKGIQQCAGSTIILNADDAKVFEIKELLNEQDFKFFSFRVESDSKISNFDSKTAAKQETDLVTELLENKVGSSRIKLNYQGQSVELELKLPGLYNTYNASAAAATAIVAGIDLETIKQGIANYHGNFGRAERKEFNSVEFQCFLIKNPTGATEVLKDLAQDPQAKYLIAINDNYADGRDVSWLWDAEFERLKTESTIICSGSRAEDMALRLKYAGIKPEQISIENNLKKALKLATSSKKANEQLYLLPTYTALLELNKL